MDADRLRALTEIMQRLAAGDRSAVLTLNHQFSDRLRPVMRAHLRRLGVHRIEPGELDGLALDACFELERVAGGWDPTAGAMPWTWASRRLGALAASWVGQHTDVLPDDVVAAADDPGAGGSAASEPEAREVFARLAPTVAEAALLDEVLAAARLSHRDQRILFEYQLQQHLGDRAPAETLAPAVGRPPDAIRQVTSRGRRRLRLVIEADERFAPLAGIPLVA